MSYELRAVGYGEMPLVASARLLRESYHAFTGCRDEVDATSPPSR